MVAVLPGMGHDSCCVTDASLLILIFLSLDPSHAEEWTSEPHPAKPRSKAMPQAVPVSNFSIQLCAQHLLLVFCQYSLASVLPCLSSPTDILFFSVLYFWIFFFFLLRSPTHKSSSSPWDFPFSIPFLGPPASAPTSCTSWAL